MTWTNWDVVEVRERSDGHKAIHARMPIEGGTLIGCFDGVVKPFELDHNDRLVPGQVPHKDIVQIRKVGRLLLGMISVGDLEGADFINHSCRPTARMEDRTIIVADRRIEIGEEITIDYRGWDFVKEGIPCWCDPPECFI